MKTVSVVAFALLTACVPFYQPLATPQTRVFDPNLVGTWTHGKQKLSFTAAKDQKSYRAVWDDDGKKASTVAELVALDERRYLDMSASKDIDYPFNTPVHLIFEVTIDQNRMLFAAMDDSRFRKLLDKGTYKLRYEKRGRDEFLVTASSTEIQAFLRAHAGEAGLFAKPEEYKRAR